MTEIIRPVTNKMSHLANCCTAATSIVGLLGGKREAGEVIPSSERNFSQDVVACFRGRSYYIFMKSCPNSSSCVRAKFVLKMTAGQEVRRSTVKSTHR